MRRTTMAVLGLMAALALLADPVMAKEWRLFDASAVVFDLNSRPMVSGRKFRSKVATYTQGAVEVWEIKNFLDGGSDYSVMIRIIISDRSVGSVVYDPEGNEIAEYGKGRKKENGYYTFEIKQGVNRVRAVWYISDDYLMSDFQVVSPEERVLTRESVIYTSRRPLMR